MTLSKTLNIILNGQDYETLSYEDKHHCIICALKSLKDSLPFETYKNKIAIIKEIKYLEELKKTVV